MHVKVDEIAMPPTPHPKRKHQLITSHDIGQIFCDGAEVKFVIEFDDVEGYVEFYPSDPNGRIIVPEDPDADAIPTERREGKITYTLREEKPDDKSKATRRANVGGIDCGAADE